VDVYVRFAVHFGSMSDGVGQSGPAAQDGAPSQQRKQAGGRPARPCNAYFEIVEGPSTGSKPDKRCLKCPGKPAVFKSAVPVQLSNHLLYECKGMDEAAKVILRAAEQEYSAKHQRAAPGAVADPAGSRRRGSESGSSVSGQPSKKRFVQMTFGNYGVVGAKESMLPGLVANASSIAEAVAEWVATDSLPFSVVESPLFRQVISLCNPNVTLPGEWLCAAMPCRACCARFMSRACVGCAHPAHCCKPSVRCAARRQLTEKHIPKVYDRVVQLQTEALAAARSITLNFDGWTTAGGVSVIGVTAITDARRSFCLGLVPVEESHTADVMRREFPVCVCVCVCVGARLRPCEPSSRPLVHMQASWSSLSTTWGASRWCAS
jgi:hypothetical protein